MVVKLKESFQKTRQVKAMTNLRGHRIARYHEKTLSNKQQSNNFINFLEGYIRYRAENFSVY